MKRILLILTTIFSLTSFAQTIDASKLFKYPTQYYGFEYKNLKLDSLFQSYMPNVLLDTTTYKLEVVNASGYHFKTSWPTFGGGTTLNALSIAAELHSGGSTTFDGSSAVSIGIQSGSVTNTMLAGSIVYSKLLLTGAILNTDLAGSIAISKLSISGTPDGTKFLKDDGSWAVPSGGTTYSGADFIVNGTSTQASANFHIDGDAHSNRVLADSYVWITRSGLPGIFLTDASLSSSISSWGVAVNSSGNLVYSTFDNGLSSEADKFLYNRDGTQRWLAYGSGTNTGTAAYNLAVDASGNVIEVATGGGGTTYSADESTLHLASGVFSIKSTYDATLVHIAGTETITGTKTFSASINTAGNLVFGTNSEILPSTNYMAFLDAASSVAWPIKVGGLTVSNDYSDNNPTNGLFVKGGVKLHTLDAADGVTYMVTVNNGTLNYAAVPSGGSGTAYSADESTLHLAGTAFSIKSTYAGQSSITTLGTIATGVWNGTVIGSSYLPSSVVYTSGSYSDPAWITSLSGTKVLPSYTSNDGKVLGLVSGALAWVANGSGGGSTPSLDAVLSVGNTSTHSMDIQTNSSHVILGDAGSSGYGAIGFISTMSATNYALMGGSAATIVNAPSGGFLALRNNGDNTDVFFHDYAYHIGNHYYGGNSDGGSFIRIAAGTATRAQFRLDAGVTLTTASDGVVEYDGTHLYFTVGTTRHDLLASGGGTTYSADESTLHLASGVFSIKSTYTGQTSITTLGTIATGVWNGTAIGDAYISSASTWNAKLTSTLTSAHLFVGNGSNVATGVALSGDASITNAGALTVSGLSGHALPSLTTGYLHWNGSAWDIASASTTPAGSNTQIQYNNSGAFGGSSDFTWDNSGKVFTANGTVYHKTTRFDEFSNNIITSGVIGTVTIDDNSTGIIVFNVTGYNPNDGAYCAYQVIAPYKKFSGTLTIGTLVSSGYGTGSEFSSGSSMFFFANSSGNLSLDVYVGTGNTTDFKASYSYTPQDIAL